MRQLIVLLSLLFSFPVLAIEEAPRDPYAHFFNDTWGDFQEETANAKAQGKKAILIFFEMDECPFCHYMKTHVLNQPVVQRYFREHFLNFSVDIEGDVEIADFNGEVLTQKTFAEKRHRVRATPVFAIFDLQGKRIARFTGRTSGVEEFLMLGQYVAEGHYQQMPFLKYKRQLKQKAKAS